MSYTIKTHEGLVRFYHAEVLIPSKQVRKYQPTDANLKSGKVFIKETGYGKELIQKTYTRKNMYTIHKEWYEQDHWAYDTKTGYVYRCYMQDGVCMEKRHCGTVPVGTPPENVLAQIKSRDITVQGAYSSQDKHSGPVGERIKHSDYPVVWSKELDGKSVIILLTVYPKMTYEEIKTVLEAEGATIDKGGIIHAKSE